MPAIFTHFYIFTGNFWQPQQTNLRMLGALWYGDGLRESSDIFNLDHEGNEAMTNI